MKLTLTEALHARPANLLVRVAARYEAVVEVWKGTCRADARKILDVLSLGAAKGDEIELRATGEEAIEAMEQIAELIAKNFDSDLVPETGSAAVEGIAIGRALVVGAPDEASREKGSAAEEAERVHHAIGRAVAGVVAMIRALAPREAALFEPEPEILRALEPMLLARVHAGDSAEDAVRAATEPATTDLLVDARDRLLDALGGTRDAALDRVIDEPDGDDLVLVTDALTPSLVASLPPRVRGIVAGIAAKGIPAGRGAPGTHTSHAAILARGRDLPLAFVPTHVATQIDEGEPIVVDTTQTPARVWVSPSESLLQDARERLEALSRAREEGEEYAAEVPLGVRVELFVNIGSIDERVPPGAEGIGLLRTELVFAGHSTPPSEAEQHAALMAVARSARGGIVTARLFDAGGDKPLPWLASPQNRAENAGEEDPRGIGLLFLHPHILASQLRALARAATEAPVRALLPMTRSPEDVALVRRAAPSLLIGAMIETPDAVRAIDAIAEASDFLCIGTNDLTAYTLGIDRAQSSNALDARVLVLVKRIIDGAHARGRKVTICGEIASDPRGACILVGLGADALSVAPARLPGLRIALRDATHEECHAAAHAAIGSR